MTYERLIIAVDEVAPELTNSAYKLLWRLIALAIHRGRPDVEASLRRLAAGLNLSKEAIASAVRELAKHITIDTREGRDTVFLLPAEWFPPQRTLFSSDELGGDFHNRPGNQDTTVLETRTLPSWKPGHHRPGNQDTRPGNQDSTVLENGTPVLETRTDRPNNQDSSNVRPIRNAHARNRSIESEASATSDVVDLIDRAWRSVEIPADREADAAVVSEWIHAYKCDLGPMQEHSAWPDTKMVARVLALAPLEATKQVLRSLRERNKPWGDQDAWFFTVLAQKVHHASPELTRSITTGGKAKARTYESKPSLFGDQLLDAVGRKARRLG